MPELYLVFGLAILAVMVFDSTGTSSLTLSGASHHKDENLISLLFRPEKWTRNHRPSAADNLPKNDSHRHNVVLTLGASPHSTTDHFLSVCLGSGIFSSQDTWKEFDSLIRSPKLQNLAKALAPTDIRIGGTGADFLTFDPDAKAVRSLVQDKDIWESIILYDLKPSLVNFTMTGEEWDNMTSFLKLVGWDLMFDFNLFKWKDDLWDPSNADLLLNYSAARGVKLPAFQLGNEPNSFHHNFNFSISPATLVKDFQILRELVSSHPSYKGSKLYGPDVTNLDRHVSSRDYLQEFIEAGAYNVVDEISLHHYYLDGRTARASDFLRSDVLDSLKLEIAYALNITKLSPKPLSIRLTETSSCYGGGAPGLSDGYVAGFLWLDKLGLAAQHGFTRIFRQTFFGGSYSLISNTLDPNPDFYLSVLYKRLIEGPVFNVSTVQPTEELRLYAHCASKKQYPAGALVIYYLNIGSEKAVVSLSQFEGYDLDLYLLTPGDDQGLKSRYVKLNGEVLLMSGSTLPSMLPQPYKGDVTVDAQSFGFIVIPHANVSLCLMYYTQQMERARA